ncbi:MAG: glycosyltransferase family 2 protein [Anaerolineae bacterium]|nr:glycosyltransferase family 2 protein [Anaerolineae bacterium]
MPPDLTISIISANNLELLLPCLHSVFENTHKVTLEVYVVDNASTDNTAVTVKAMFPQVKVIRNEIRQGFSTNNNMVLGSGRGRYLMLLNDDTVVLDKALDHMVEFMDTHPQAGAAGSFLLNPDGSFQPAFSRFPNPFIEGIWAATNWSYQSARQATEPFEVDSVCGAAMLVRRQIIEQVGVLDIAFDPIYSEEVDWCYRIKHAGWQIYALPHARIIHYGSQTMNRVMPHKYELLLSHKRLFFCKYWGASAARIYTAALTLSTIVKLAWWLFVALLQKSSLAAKERMKLHWYLLKHIPSL